MNSFQGVLNIVGAAGGGPVCPSDFSMYVNSATLMVG